MKKIVICLLFILPIAFGMAVSTEASQNQNNNVQNLINNELEAIYEVDNEFEAYDEMYSEEKKIEDIIEVFFFAKTEYTKPETNIDILNFFSEEYRDNYEHVMDLLNVRKNTREKLDSEILWDSLNVEVKNIEVKEENAKVSVEKEYEYILDDYDNGFSGRGKIYEIELKKIDNMWKITSINSEDPVLEIYKEGVNVDEKVDSITSKAEPNKEMLEKENYFQKETKELLSNEYVRSDAALYAEIFSCNEPGTDCYSDLFPDYAGDGGDCQNFASQSVWHGFGGYHFKENIDNKEDPMIPSGDRAWYHTTDKYDTPTTWVWTGASQFYNYIEESSYDSEGPYGFSHDANVSFAQKGDIIKIPGHVYVINDVAGEHGERTMNDIWVCAHTTNRYNDNLADVGISLEDLKNIRIQGHNSAN